MSQQQRSINAVFYDEEDCLGFGVFVAELELILGTSRDRRPDQMQLLELLQKLQASISTAEARVLKQHQKRCEAALYDIVYKGSCAVVRNLVATCLSRLYAAGDMLPLFSSVYALQTFLQDKNNTAAEAVRLGVLDVLVHLTATLGRYLASSSIESMAIAAKALVKGSSNSMKLAGLRLAAAVAETLPHTDRNSAAVQAETWKLVEKQIKEKEKGPDELRAAYASLLAAMCRAGGSLLWTSAGYYAEEALKLAVAGLTDDTVSQTTREAFAVALADLAAAALPTNGALAAAVEAEKKPAKRQQLEKTAGGLFQAALVQPFVDATVQGSICASPALAPLYQDVCTALVLGWSHYASRLTASSPAAAAPDALVGLALRAVSMLEACSKAAIQVAAQAPLHATDNIGACLAGGEMPAPTAAVIYFMRTAVICRMPEPSQRRLLSELARATSHAIAPPVIIAAMEGCGVLLELLGEVHDETAIKAVENAAMSKLSASSTAVRHQAAAVVAALALSSPALLARLFGECLEGVETFCQQLMLLAAPYTKPRASVSSSSGGAAGSSVWSSGTPRGAPDSQTNHCIDGLHGNALAVGALLIASARSALGAPSRLTRSVFWIAKRMISQPYCSCPWAVAAEREAGYMLLGSMCAAAAPNLLAGRKKQQQILELFGVALGQSAADALSGTAAVAAAAAAGGTAGVSAGAGAAGTAAGPGGGLGLGGSGDAELELAVSCWWRAAALQALSAYVLGVMGKGFAEDPAQQVRVIASMLSPLLEVINKMPHLADPTTAAAAAAAAAPSPTPAAPPSPSGSASSSNGSTSAAAAAAAAASTAPGSFSAAGVPAAGSSGSFSSSPSGAVAAAAAALLQLRLLEVFFFLPAPQFWAHCHGHLLHLCCRQLMGTGGSRVNPDAASCVSFSSLKHMLNSQDALLGPWLPGRDMLEDELRTFVGERGGPQQHPWEVGAAFTEGFITYSQALLPPDDTEAAAAATATAAAAAAAAAAGTDGAAAAAAAAAAFGDGGLSSSEGCGVPGGPGAADSNGEAPQLAALEQQRRGVDGVRLRRRFMPYPQPYALGPALLEAQLWLLGKLLAVVNSSSQMQVLEVMLNAVNVKSFATAAATSGRAAAARQRAANCTAVALAGLAGLSPLAKRVRGDGSDKLAEKVLHLASCMLEDQVYDPCLARAGAEMMAAAACIGSTTLALGQVKAITTQLSSMMDDVGAAAAAGITSASGGADAAVASSAELRAVLCLVLGCIHRARGGAALQPTVAATVEALVAVASRPVGMAHIWALHGLWLVAGAAGPAYAPHVKQSLQLALELLVSSFGEHPMLQPAAARLANAMIAVLGPEFTLGSAAYSRCKTLVTDNSGSLSAAAAAAAAAAGGGGGSAAAGSAGGGAAAAGGVPVAAGSADGLRGLAVTWAELEQVLFAQQLILFAPQAVPAAKHLPLLLLTLTSSRPALRRAAAATLRHLADRDAAGLAQARIESSLLAALDGESEPSTSSQLRGTLTALLCASAPKRPGYWLRLLGAVALAAPQAGTAGQAVAAAASAIQADEDEEAEVRAAAPPAEAAAPSHAPAAAAAAAVGPAQPGPGAPLSAAAAAAAAAAVVRLPPTPRLRTRLFAAELLLLLFAAVGPDPRHRVPKPTYDDGVAALDSSSSSKAATPAVDGEDEEPHDFLVSHLQPLIDLGYKLTTCSAESLRPSGAQLLQQTLRFFGAVPDPDVPEVLLLEQYQAQFVAALRAALAPGGAPALAVCGGTLATSFLSAGLAAGDGAVMRRLMDLLVAPLEAWQNLLYGGFAESVGVRARAALLQAHAQCANLASAFGGGSSRVGAGGVGGPGCSLTPRSSSSSSNNELCRQIVVRSQAPHREMLLLLWWGVLLDYAAFTSSLPGFMQNHKSLLFGDTYPEVVEAVLGTYTSAWPPVLIALASNLPPPAELAAAARPAAAPAAADTASSQQQLEQERQAAWSAFVDQVSSGAILPGSGSSSSSSSSSGGGGSSGSSSGAKTGTAGAGAGPTAAAAVADRMFRQQLTLQCEAMHGMLVDVSLMLLCDTASACAAAFTETTGASSSKDGSSRGSTALAAPKPVVQQQQELVQQVPQAAVAAGQRVAVALQALQLLLTQQHFEAGLASPVVCQDVAGRLSALAVEVLGPWQTFRLAQQQQQQQEQQRRRSSGGAVVSRSCTAAGASSSTCKSGSVGQQGASWPAAAAADKVFGLVLLAAAGLLQSLACGLQTAGSAAAEAAGSSSSSSEATTALVEALLALSSIAVPFEAAVIAGTPSKQQQQLGFVACLPALLQYQQQQQAANGARSSWDGSGLSTAAPSPQAVAACNSLCQAGGCLLQQLPSTSEANSSCEALKTLSSLSIRLLLTSAPGQQLAVAQQLLESCCAAVVVAAAAAGQQPQSSAGTGVGTGGAAAVAASMCEVLCAAVTAAVQQMRSSSSSKQPQIADVQARLPALLAALLAAAAACSTASRKTEAAAEGSGVASLCTAAVQKCCGVLQWTLQQHSVQNKQQQQQQQQQQHAEGEGGAAAACKVLEAVRVLLQESAAPASPAAGAVAADQQLRAGKAALAQLVTGAVVPQAAVLIHAAMSSGKGPLTGAELAAVTEGLKVLLLLSNRTAAQGEAAQVAVMSVLVPLLVEVAHPPPGTLVTSLLRDMACKLVSAMPTSAAASAFRTAVMALPAASKQRLQLALKEQQAAAAAAAAPAAAGGAAAGAAGVAQLAAPAEARKPAIQLKMNFAMPGAGK